MFEQLNMLNDAAVFIYKSLGIKINTLVNISVLTELLYN